MVRQCPPTAQDTSVIIGFLAIQPILPWPAGRSDTLGMALCHTGTVVEPIVRESPGRTWWDRAVCWIAEARSHRIICLVAGIWLLNGFDLVFTLLSHEHGLLFEENPLAREMLGQGVVSVVLYKIGLVLIGTYPLLKFRRVRITELGTFVVFLVYALLAIRWSTCFKLYSMGLTRDTDVAGVAIVDQAPRR